RYRGEPQIGNFFIRSRLCARRCDRFDATVHLPHTFARPVIDDHDLGFDGVEKRGRSSTVECTVTAVLIYGDHAELVYRARELHFFFPIEIDQIQVFELAVTHEHAGHTLIFEPYGSFLFGRGAKRIRAAAADGLGQNLLIRSDDEDTESLER